MLIRIKADGHNIHLWLPTSLLKSRIGYNVVKNMLRHNQTESAMPISREQVVEMHTVIKRAIKEHGHFNLVEVESADGQKVLIRV